MAQNQKMILIIEDEEDTLLFLKDRLEMEGYQVMTANNGQEGLEKARELRPNLILLDVMLPKMNGYQVCQQLKQDANTQTLPIILITAKSQKSDRLSGKESGWDDYVTKPFDTNELLKKITHFLK